MLSFDKEAFFHQFLYDPHNPLLFNNGFFVWFFALFIGLYYAFRRNYPVRTYILCFFSLYFFYKASGSFVVLVLISAVVDYVLSNLIYRQQNQLHKKLLLLLSIFFNLGMLFYFKYTNFFITLSNTLFTEHFQPLNILLPVGISFYTFENLSYTIDVYKGEFVPERKFANYLLFLSFFPKLVMGPIVRARDFIPQLHEPYVISETDFAKGFYLIFSGLFKKLVISDFITLNFVNYVFDAPGLHTGLECLVAVYGYAIVIYCDFSGYSDVAIGMARWLGITIPPNFLSPYQSRNITEFWRRWHISLSSWLRDYLYIFGLGGNRKGTIATYIIAILFFVGLGFGIHQLTQLSVSWSVAIAAIVLLIFLVPAIIEKKLVSFTTSLNLLATMLLGGFWHGASWNFIIWGAMHGVALGIHKIWMMITGKQPTTNPIASFLSILLTFHFVCFCWVFFKAADYDTALQMIAQITQHFSLDVLASFATHYSSVLYMMALGLFLHFLPDGLADRIIAKYSKLPVVAYLAIFVVFLLVYAQFKGSEQVMPIYLQF